MPGRAWSTSSNLETKTLGDEGERSRIAPSVSLTHSGGRMTCWPPPKAKAPPTASSTLLGPPSSHNFLWIYFKGTNRRIDGKNKSPLTFPKESSIYGTLLLLYDMRERERECVCIWAYLSSIQHKNWTLISLWLIRLKWFGLDGFGVLNINSDV